MIARAHLTPLEEIIVKRARERGGECFMSYGEASAVLHLTELGIGHWEQRSPFIATFVLHSADDVEDG